MQKTITRQKLNEIFIVCSFLLYLLFTQDSINAIPAFKTSLSRQVILVLSLLLFLLPLILELKKSIRERKMVVVLLLRFLYFPILSLIYMEDYYHFLSYLLLISIFPIVFICISNLKIDSYSLLVLLTKISVILVAVQISTAFLYLVFSGHGLFQIKHLIAIPFGNSNTIASIIVLQTVLCLFLLKNRIYFIISIISLLFTISRWGFFSFIIIIGIALILKSNDKHKVRTVIIYTVLLVLIYVVLSQLLPTYLVVYNNAISNLFNSDYANLFNGRDTVYDFYYDRIVAQPVFGYGLGIETPECGMAHNFLFQSLYFGGIIGSLIYYCPYIVLLKNNQKASFIDRFFFPILVLALFVNGFAENCFFTAPAEFISAIYISLLYRCQSETRK